MIALSNAKGIVGLDLETGSVAAAEVQVNGAPRVTSAAVHQLPPGVVRDGEVTDVEGLSAALKEMFAQSKLSKNVRLGIANQRVVVRTMRMPAIDDPKELETAIRFQAQEQIPMPLDQAVLEHQVVGRSTGEGGESFIDVVLVAARREMISPLVVSMRKAGLKPVGIDLSAFAMIRALAREASAGDHALVPSYEERMAGPGESAEAVVPAMLYCNLGDATNLAVAQGGACLFTRISQFGIEGIAQRLAERRALTLDHARQWLVHVGLLVPVEEVDGDPETVAAARNVLAEGATKLVDELRLSVEYYGAQEQAVAVEAVVTCGAGTSIPGLAERIERELGLPVVAPRPQPLAHLDESTAARLTLSYGLALEA
jgi:type IV pilus assembly protein PilM